MKPALAQVCSLNSSFEQDVEDYAAGQCTAIELWLTKLEAFVDSRGTADVQRLLETHEVDAPVASYHGGLLASQGERRQEAWELFGRRLDLCRELHVGTIVIACDVPVLADQQDIQRVQASLELVAEEARRRDIRVAVEFQAASALGNNLQTMASLVAEVAHPHLGVCFDSFHFYVGTSKLADLELLTSENCFHVQLSDIAGVPRELAADSDRILPGEGDIPLEPIIERLRAIGYAGHVSIELMNPQIWQVPALQFGEIGMTALRKLLGQAAMN